jgi:hypothetical protein
MLLINNMFIWLELGTSHKTGNLQWIYNMPSLWFIPAINLSFRGRTPTYLLGVDDGATSA